MAALVVCSWPRAELTTLSYRHKPADNDSVRETLGLTKTNAERSTVIAAALIEGTPLALSSPSDVAACQRMTRLLMSPSKELGDVRKVLVGVLRRLYRQRNIVLHGGTTASAALDSTLRTAAPLVGAGLDRLVHAKLILNVEPLDLGVRAENSLALLGDELGPTVTALLE